MYDAETLTESMVWAEGRRVRLGLSDHCHVGCTSPDIARDNFQVSLDIDGCFCHSNDRRQDTLSCPPQHVESSARRDFVAAARFV